MSSVHRAFVSSVLKDVRAALEEREIPSSEKEFNFKHPWDDANHKEARRFIGLSCYINGRVTIGFPVEANGKVERPEVHVFRGEGKRAKADTVFISKSNRAQSIEHIVSYMV